jgi:regulator of nucleoside diphosphate kinase
MNVRATYRMDEDREPESRVLVYPEDYTPLGGQVSVLSPVGAALLGLRAGSRMPYRMLGGSKHCLVVEEVGGRPQATVVPFRPRRSPPPWDDPGPGSAA